MRGGWVARAVGGRRHLKPVGWPVTLTGVSVTGPATGLFGTCSLSAVSTTALLAAKKAKS